MCVPSSKNVCNELPGSCGVDGLDGAKLEMWYGQVLDVALELGIRIRDERQFVELTNCISQY